MGRKKTDEQEKAFDLYCNTSLTQKEIAGVIKVSAQQMNKWVKDGNWEMLRSANKVTLPAIVQNYYLQLAAINKEIKDQYKGVPTIEHSDTICKIANSIEKLNKKHNLSAYHAVLRETLEWMVKVDSEKAKSLGPLMLEFLREKAQKLNDDQTIG
jgi:predicted DNA-binding protein YlxM (UPF0122 family)